MKQRTAQAILAGALAIGAGGHAEAQLNAGVKLEAKAGVKVDTKKSTKAKTSAKGKAAPVKAKTAKSNTLGLKAKANLNAKNGIEEGRPRLSPAAARHSMARARLHGNQNLLHEIKARKEAAIKANARGKVNAKAKPNANAIFKANANAAFKVPAPEFQMNLYGEGYAKLSVEEKRRVRTERRAARWKAFRARHKAVIKVEQPKLLPPSIHAEWKLNARRTAKLQRIRFLAKKNNEAKLAAKAGTLIEKEEKRHGTKLTALLQGEATIEAKGN